MRTDAGGGDPAHRLVAGAGSAQAATNRSNTASASSGPGAPSGWYWTVSIGSSRWRRPSTEPSLRLTWLTWKPPARGSVSATTWTSWFWAVTWTRPRVDVADRVVRPVMAEPQPARLGAGRPGHDLVAEADPEQRPTVVDRGPGQRDRPGEPRRVARPGRQDEPVDVRRRARRPATTVWGRTRTRAPRRRSERTMFALSP